MKTGSPTSHASGTAKFLKQCICESCPTYLDCGAQGHTTEKAFCLATIGKSACISVENGCLCDACPVKSELKMKHLY